MLLRELIVKTVKYHLCASPIVVGDVLGEDKFRVLKIMRQLERDGLLVRCFGCSFACDRMVADQELWITKEDLSRDGSITEFRRHS